MAFKEYSEWNEKTELQAYLIFRQLEEKNFPRGMQSLLCEQMAKNTKLDKGSISAKISNYKSEAGINNASNSSINTKENYKKYQKYDIYEIERMIARENTL